jgi:hypothetical protein
MLPNRMVDMLMGDEWQRTPFRFPTYSMVIITLQRDTTKFPWYLSHFHFFNVTKNYFKTYLRAMWYHLWYQSISPHPCPSYISYWAFHHKLQTLDLATVTLTHHHGSPCHHFHLT